MKILDLNHSDTGKYICGAVEEEDDDDDEDDDNLVAVNGTVCLILQGEVSCVLLHVEYIVMSIATSPLINSCYCLHSFLEC